MKKKNVSMEAVNPNAAGIDIGSRSHFVAIGQADEDVKEQFTLWFNKHDKLIDWDNLSVIIDHRSDILFEARRYKKAKKYKYCLNQISI